MEFEPKLYNPAAQPEEWLIEHFVVRTKVFERIFDDLKTGDMKHPEQHYLVQGQRGMGKTTLLLRLKYEIERTNGLKEWLMPVFFSEESYDLTSLSALWEKLLKYFDAHLPDGGGYYGETDKYMDRDDYEQLCFDLVLRILRKNKQKIVILFDNFGELFLDNLSEKESHRFREILMTCAEIRIVAASAVVLESHNDYSEPFFDFFKIINLKGLNKTETVDLINKLQEKSDQKLDVAANRARIETMAILTGGVIRTIMMLYEILLNDHDGSALKDLERILDKVTPLYKHRMEDLKPQQRRIMDVIAKNWDAMSAREISENIRENGKQVPSKTISAQLQELEKNNLVEKIKTSTKNNLYIVQERFFNIWYLMRHGDKTTQCKVKWLTRFLEMWYGEENQGMDGFIDGYVEKLQTGNFIPSSALTITNALLSSGKTSPVNQARLLHETESIVSEEEGKYLPKVDMKAFDAAMENFEKGNFRTTIEMLEQTSLKNQDILLLLARAYFIVEEYGKIISVLEKINNPFALAFSGFAYIAQKNYVEGEGCLNIALKNIDDRKPLESQLKTTVIATLLSLHFLLRNKPAAVNLAQKTLTSHALAGLTANAQAQIFFITLTFIWINEFEEALKLLHSTKYFDSSETDRFNTIILFLLSKRQYHLALNIFNGNTAHLKDKLKPTYYALMLLLKDEYPDEYLKMGKELEQPVRDVLRKIEQYAIDYA